MKFRTLTVLCVMTLLAMMALSVQSSAKPTITIFNAPGAGTNAYQGTGAISMNDAGVIVGVVIDPFGFYHGFLRAANGDITIFDVPHALDTVIYSINNKGEIAGYYVDKNGVEHGFKRDAGGKVTKLDFPGAAGTEAVNINDAGKVSGTFIDNKAGEGDEHGWEKDGGFNEIDAPGAENTIVVPNGMNASGAITGYKGYAQIAGSAWVDYPNGDFPTFDVYGALFTYANGIAADGTVVGYSYDLTYVSHGYTRTEDGTITQLDDPNAGVAPGLGTQAYAINKTLWITGAFADPHNKVHGFVSSPKGVFTTFNIPGAITITPAFINSAGVIAGYWQDKNGAYHSFVRTP